MAAAGRNPDHPLSAQLRRDYAGFDFYQLVRLLLREQGTAAESPALERCVRFRTDLSLAFPANEVTHVAEGGKNKAITVTTRNYGVAGYLGPLPESFSEWIRECRVDGNRTLTDFIDLFTHRLNTLRFRLKARVHPVLGNQLPERTLLAEALAAVVGFHDAELPTPLPRRVLFGASGVLGNRRRTVSTLEQILARCLGAAVRVRQFVGAWQSIPPDNRLRLGRQNSRLGRDAVVGEKVWNQAARIEVNIGALPYARFAKLLPSGATHAALVGLLRFLTDRQVDCEVQLSVDAATVPRPILLSSSSPARPQEGKEQEQEHSGPRLAYTAWFATKNRAARAARFLVPAYDMTELDHAA